MTVALKPLGVTCNIQCQYCYQNPMRDADGKAPGYDIEKMKAAIDASGGPFALFGGEALLVPEADLEALWAWGLEKYGRNSVQTNGTLINDAHLRLFRDYKVAVGISIDGPGELNNVRWAGTLEATREATAKTQAAIERLCAKGMAPGLIVTLHRGNATRERLPALHAWFRHLERIGVRAARLHVLEVEASSVRDKYGLSVDENVEALLSLLKLQEEELKTLEFDMFRDMRNLLLGEDEKSSCVWNACDPYTTKAVRGVEGDGQLSNCDRTNTEGIDFVKSAAEGFERYLALYHTPQENGGCKDCRFFLACKGQCPGTAIGGDWRNRTEYCEVWKRVYQHLEARLSAQGKTPVSLRADRTQLERMFLEAWESGRNTNIAQSLKRLAQRENPRPAGDFVLPDFTRIAWVSERARQAWEPRLAAIMKAWAELEWRSVLQGVRQCALVMVDPQELVVQTNEWARHGLQALPVSLQKLYRTVVGKPRSVASFRRALDAGDGDAAGRLLGYPPCCSEFAQHAAHGCLDPTWAVAAPGGAANGTADLVEAAGPFQCNILWRWAGVRAVPHMPCSFGCEPSVELADTLIDVGVRAGYAAEMGWLREILSWPAEWSALHGIAEIRTPILKIATRTDATPRKRAVRRPGTSYPAEGAKGLMFPYRRPHALRFTDSKAFRRGLQHPLGSIPPSRGAHEEEAHESRSELG